jgi:bifunctional enzyme CysN/CysC
LPGDTVEVAGSGIASKVARIVTFDGDVTEAIAGDAVTITLEDEIDASRGNVLADAEFPLLLSDQFAAHLIWLTDAPMMAGRDYLFKIGTRVLPGTITRIRHRIDVNTREKLHADTLVLNDVAKVHLSLSQPVAFEPYATSRDLGGFILIDRQTNGTVAVGMIDNELSRASNIVWHKLDVTRTARAAQKGQKPAVLWFTGLSGSGKSTIANLVEKRLFAMGRHTYLLDGDNVRHGLNRDLGFSESDRVENIRRVGEVATLFADAGLITIVSFISPYRSERDAARERVGEHEFIEVFVDTPIDECRRRDPKGLYVKADAGQIPNFTGISAPYEAPENAEIHLKTVEADATVMAEKVVVYLRDRGLIG